MEVADLCIRLLTGVLVLLVATVDHSYFAQKTDAVFPRVVPDRLQFFEYENFSVRCVETDAFTGWRVMRKLNNIHTANSSTWNTSAPSFSIQLPFERDSGEYWCENEEGNRSRSVNISVTAGSVILESPAHPVMEGHDVILHCRNKKTESEHIADFYKDGSLLRTLYTNRLTIQNVPKSDEGVYKCSISAAGESPESRLTVTQQTHEQTHTPHVHSPGSLTPLWIVVTASLVFLLLLLLLLVGLCRKHKVSGEDNAADPNHATYAVVNKRRKEKVSESSGENAVDPDHVTYANVRKQGRKKKEAEMSRSGTKTSSSYDSVIYSSVGFHDRRGSFDESSTVLAH